MVSKPSRRTIVAVDVSPPAAARGTKMRFDAPEGSLIDGVLRYVVEDRAFAFEPDGQNASRFSLGSSLAVGTLMVEADLESGRLLWVDGYAPYESWVHRDDLSVPNDVTVGSVTVLDAELEVGTSRQIADIGIWSRTYDPTTGWVRVADPAAAPVGTTVLIATGTALTIVDDQLSAIWLCPVIDGVIV